MNRLIIIAVLATATVYGRNINEMTTDNSESEDIDTPSDVSWGNKQVAFSTYLSSDLNELGKGQHIKFDKVMLNDGKGYEHYTGIFRPPLTGVYQFTFVVAQRHAQTIRANLLKNGEIVIGAIAEGMHKWQDAQGTNTVIIHACKGDAIWIEATKGDHLEGDPTKYRYTSFSGHLLYERK